VGAIPAPGEIFPLAFLAPEPTGHWGWDQRPCLLPLLYKKDCTDDDDFMSINLTDQAHLVRSPSSHNLLLTHMDTLENGKGHGFRQYITDGKFSWDQLAPIAPKTPHPDNFILHVTGVDAGRGPIFYYWYDVDTVAQSATIAGRLVTLDNMVTDDFAVKRTGTLASSFDVTAGRVFYGDYHTAGGYYAEAGPGQWSHSTYHYYPVWIESDGKVRFAHVRYDMPLAIPHAVAATFGHRAVSPRNRTMYSQSIDAARLLIEREEPVERMAPPR
jgi:hypothetical protein